MTDTETPPPPHDAEAKDWAPFLQSEARKLVQFCESRGRIAYRHCNGRERYEFNGNTEFEKLLDSLISECKSLGSEQTPNLRLRDENGKKMHPILRKTWRETAELLEQTKSLVIRFATRSLALPDDDATVAFLRGLREQAHQNTDPILVPKLFAPAVLLAGSNAAKATNLSDSNDFEEKALVINEALFTSEALKRLQEFVISAENACSTETAIEAASTGTKRSGGGSGLLGF